jgi:uncharacterized protein YjbI with pentapeptide repeats
MLPRFARADLTSAYLHRSALSGADFTGAIVTGASFFDTTAGGFTADQLYSTASYHDRNLKGVYLRGNDLTGWDLSNQDLTNASFRDTTMTDVNLTGASIGGTTLPEATLRGFTAEQLYSTASYQNRNLAGIPAPRGWLNDPPRGIIDQHELDQVLFGATHWTFPRPAPSPSLMDSCSRGWELRSSF